MTIHHRLASWAHHTGRIGLAVCTIGGLTAAEFIHRDLTLALEALPTAYDWESSRAGLSLSGDDNFGTHFGVSIGGRTSWARPGSSFGTIIGIEAAVARGQSDDVTLDWAEARLLAGVGWAPAPGWSVQSVLRVGAGLDRLTTAGTGDIGDFLQSGTHIAIAPEASVWWEPSNSRWRFSLGVGWRQSTIEVEHDGLSTELRQGGPTVALGISWQWSQAPGRFE